MKQTKDHANLAKMSLWRRCHYEALKAVLTHTKGKLSPASRILGISLPTARKQARELGLWPWKNGKQPR